jgi:hypothetical protein
MKQKILLLFIFVSCFSYVSMAQLTTGKSTANVIRNGNRASAGDFGLYFGVTSDIFHLNSIDDDFGDGADVTNYILPLVNLKYMATDNIEYRLGIEFNKKSALAKGSDEVGNKSYDFSQKYTNVENSIYPGIAYHFSKDNLLDVYVGAELPLGYKRNTWKVEDESIEETLSTTSFAYHFGLGAFIGVQAYVANLPVAIGFEYGISSLFDFGLKNKTKLTQGKTTTTSYETDFSGKEHLLGGNNFDATGDELTVRTGEVGNQIRFTLTYFFKQ